MGDAPRGSSGACPRSQSRRSHMAAGVLTVFLMTNRFADEPQYSNSVTIPLPVATQDTAELIRYALRGIEELFREGYRYQKAGVILTALVPAYQIQTHLFDQHDRERSQKLMAAIDAINREWGLDHGVGHFRPLSITRHRHLLTYYGTAMSHEGLCQVF
jgi:hypothetical protein